MRNNYKYCFVKFNTENKIEIKSDHTVSDDHGKKGNVETWKQRKTYSHMPD